MAKDSPRQWDTTPASNTDIGGITLAENVMRPPAVNNAMREHMGQIAEYIDEMSYPTAGGSADALTLTPATASAAYASNDVWTFKAASSNTGAATLNISGLGAKAIRKISGGADVALSAGDIAAAGRYTVTYDSTANSAAGAWILVGAPVGEKGSSVASASTISLGEGSLFHITGTTTITDIDFATPRDGRAATLIFDGALTLTHNGTTLNLPGLADITTAAGDRCDIVQDDADNIYVTNYTPSTAAPYRSGTFTPSLKFGGGSTGMTYSVREGYYVKIGRLVYFDIAIILTAKGSSTGSATIIDLPFVCANNVSRGVVLVGQYANLASISGLPKASMNSNASSLTIFNGAAATQPSLTEANFTNTSSIILSGSYRI